MPEGVSLVHSAKQIMISVCAGLVLMCAGCGLTLDNSRYRYVPGEMLHNQSLPLPATVVVERLKDARGREREENLGYLFLPLVPYAGLHYDRPETEKRFSVKGLDPGADFARALVEEMDRNDLFCSVSGLPQAGTKADLIVTGTLREARVDTEATFYGGSFLGLIPWIAGLPQGKVYNSLWIDYEMRRVGDGALVWKWTVKGKWSRIFGLYYGYSKDEPYTGMNLILRKSLRDGLAVLARDLKDHPAQYLPN